MTNDLSKSKNSEASVSRLRRDLGTLESYAALIGILIGAGIFQVTSQAWALTGPSVILGYVLLMPAILATSIPYAAFLSTPLGREPGGEYLHISRALGGYRLAYIGAWLKIISYVGAGAYLANAQAGYLIAFSRGSLNQEKFRLPLAVAGLLFFYAIHVVGIRWFGRVQVIMGALKVLALLVLILPGLFVLHAANYTPFVTHGISGFAASLLPLFFAYAGFESLAQTAGETKDSTRRLPKILLRGITATALIYVFTSIVSFGVLPGARLQSTNAPMAEVASVYLPVGAAMFVTFGAIMAIMTTPIPPLTLTLRACILLLISGQLSLALNVAVFALVVLYFIHSLVFLLLPYRNPKLDAEITVNIPTWLQRVSAVFSVVAMGMLIVIQLLRDADTLSSKSLSERISEHSLTSIELVVVWSIVGAGLYGLARLRAGRKLKMDET